MPARIICIGNTTLDKVWPVHNLPVPGGKCRASDYFEVGGGMAANAAVTIARLGGSVAYWGRAGDDNAGHTMKNEMRSYGVDVSHFRLFSGARSSTAAVLVANDGERTIVNFRGAGLPDDPGWLPLERVAEVGAVLADIRWIEGACAVFTQARRVGVPTVLDAEIAQPPAFSATLPLVDHAIFSEAGLCSFLGKDALSTEAERVEGLQRVRESGCRVAALTRGSEGVFWVDDNGVHHQTAFAVEVVDTTGAGDVFHGAYTLALAEARPVPEAMRFASAVAALKCRYPGGRAGIPSRAEALAFLGR